jgi:pyruvate/2-oxoacid:ferredoxin oxidoreductase alpha subunit
MLKQTEGSHAVAEAVALCRPDVICAYPISPQTHIVEGLGELVKSGALSPCEFINVESEFAAMSVAIGSSATGARTYTATASQGLLFMAEAVYNASGLGLPIVMTIANRAIGAPINIWNDHSDSMSQRDSGWLQLFAETNQEALDLHIQAFRLAEELSMPVMVCMDGFILTHAYERVDIPTRPTSMPSCRLTSRARCSIRPILSRSARWSGRRPSWRSATSLMRSRFRRSSAFRRSPPSSRPASGETPAGWCAATGATTQTRSSSPSAR